MISITFNESPVQLVSGAQLVSFQKMDAPPAAAAAEAPLTEKQLLNLQKQKLLRQQFMEYLLKQVAEVTHQYNCFENSSLMDFISVRPCVYTTSLHFLTKLTKSLKVQITVCTTQ